MKPRQWPPSRDNAQLHRAHDHSSDHRLEVSSSTRCACFYCLAIFSPTEIVEWIDEDAAGVGRTAACPKCSVDSVLGDRSGFQLTEEFLQNMHAYWFGAEAPVDVSAGPRHRHWAAVEERLRAASRLLPLEPHDLTPVQEWLRHNELGLALDELEGLAEKCRAQSGFWLEMEAAARMMELAAHAERYRLRARDPD